MNIVHKHSCYTAKNTTYEHQVLVLLVNQPLCNMEELQKDPPQTHQETQNEMLAPDT